MKAAADFLGCTEKTLEKAQEREEGERIVVDGYDITIPAFLRRQGGKRLSETQVKAMLAAPDWKPFKYNEAKEKDNAMAKLNALIENPEAPVTVHLRGTDDKEKDISFGNMSSFEAWYRPNVHRYIGSRTTKDFTDISIDLRTRLEDMNTEPALNTKPKKTVYVKGRALPTEAKPAAKKPLSGNRGAGSSTVWADGKEYRSVLLAFEQLKLDVKKHKKFRADLKKARKLEYTEGKRTVKFEYR